MMHNALNTCIHFTDLCVKLAQCVGVERLGVAEVGTLKFDFGGKTRRNLKIIFRLVIYGL